MNLYKIQHRRNSTTKEILVIKKCIFVTIYKNKATLIFRIQGTLVHYAFLSTMLFCFAHEVVTIPWSEGTIRSQNTFLFSLFSTFTQRTTLHSTYAHAPPPTPNKIQRSFWTSNRSWPKSQNHTHKNTTISTITNKKQRWWKIKVIFK